MFKGYIYRHWIINEYGVEKSYIGQTYQSTPQERWRKDGKGYLTDDTKFSRAIIKYGWDSFNHEVIGVVYEETMESLVYSLNEWEIFYIEKYNSFYNGYNSTTGGGSGYILTDDERERRRNRVLGEKNPMYGKKGELNPFYGRKHTEEAKKKMAKARIGKSFPCSEETKRKLREKFIGRKFTEETKRKMSIARKGKYTGELNPFYGKKHTEETKKHLSNTMKEKYDSGYINPMKGKQLTDEHKRKISEARTGQTLTDEHKHKLSEIHKGKQKGKENPNAKSIICLNTLQIFDTVKEATDWCGGGAITKCCKGVQKRAGKHPQTGETLTWSFYDEYVLMTNKQVEQKIKDAKENDKSGGLSKKVICLNTLQVFDTIKEATDWCKSKTICNCCKGKQKTAGTHPETGEPLKWMYYDEYLKLHENK